MKVYIKTLTEVKEEYPYVIIENDSSGLDLKEAVASEFELQTDGFKILYNSKKVKDDESLSVREIVDGSSVIMIRGRSKPSHTPPFKKETKETKEDELNIFKNIMDTKQDDFIKNLMTDAVISRMVGNDKDKLMELLKDPEFLNKVVGSGRVPEEQDVPEKVTDTVKEI